jgi:hypothetical protein
MITLPYIEDYIEVMANLRSLPGSKVGFGSLFAPATAQINLARYDVNIVSSMAQQTSNNTGLTDRQGELAIKLVAKYQRQFAGKGVDVAPSVENPQFRNALRVIDRTRSISLTDNKIVLRFPYESALVNAVTSASKVGAGSFKFDRDKKIWELGLTEHNINWSVVFGQEHQFTISEEIQNLMQLILDCEKTDYKIELVAVNNGIDIVNAEDTLRKYINDNLGGLVPDNFIKLVDYAPVLGYTVHRDIQQCVENEFDPIVSGIMFNKESHVQRTDALSTGEEFIASLLKYSEITGRWPICIYEPDTSFKLKDAMLKHIKEEELLDMSKRVAEVDFTGIKCVYFTKLKRAWAHPVPILVSTNAMLYGNEKQAMLHSAQKIVYYTATTLNREAKTIAGEVIN